MSEFAEVTPEFGSRPEDLVAFNDTITSIDEHNNQYSLGKLMAKALIEHMNKTQRVNELVQEGATQEVAEETVDFVGDDNLPLTEEEQMARSIVGMTNAPVLESTGLTLSPLRTTATMYNSTGKQAVGEVRLHVTDGGKFSNFLLTVTPESVTEEFQNNVAIVASSIVTEATAAIVSDTGEQTASETLAYSKGIVAGLENVGLGDSPVTARLNDLSEHAQQGDVKEYVVAGKIGLLKEPEDQGFGPAQWQRDANPEFLASHWSDVLKVVKAAKENPNATALFTQLVESAQASLDYAKADWIKLRTEEVDYGNRYGEGFDDIFATVDIELGMISSPDKEN